MTNHSAIPHDSPVHYENPPLPEVYDLADVLAEDAAAKRFQRSKFWLARLRKETIRSGAFFPARKIGNQWYYFGRELATWIAQQGQAGGVSGGLSVAPGTETPAVTKGVLSERLRAELEERLRMLEREHVARVLATIKEFEARSG